MHKYRKTILGILIFFTVTLTVNGQKKYDNLKKWVGKYPRPEFNQKTGNIFTLPEIKIPLKKLLPRDDYEYVTKLHTKETPIENIENHLKISVCGKGVGGGCTDHTVMVFSLTDGAIYVGINLYGIGSGMPRFYSTKGKFTDLPKVLQKH